MRTTFFLFLLFVLASCTADNSRQPGAPSSPNYPIQPPTNGHIVGNGGDPLEAIYGQAKNQWHRVVDRFHTIGIDILEKRSSVPATRSDLDLLKKHAKDISTTLKSSKHTWSNQLPAGCPPTHTCGCTLDDKPNEVFLSYDSCRIHASNKEAGSVLFHEALHSVLKMDEETIRRLTTLAFAFWEASGHADGPYYFERAKTAIKGGYPYFPPVKTGTFEIAIPMENVVAFYDIEKNVYRHRFPKNKPNSLDYYDEPGPHFHNQSFKVKDQLVVFQQDYGQFFFEKPVTATGMIYDLKKNEWLPLPIKDAPEDRYAPAQVATNDALFVFGGLGRKAGQQLFNGSLYEPEKGWRPVAPNPLMKLEKEAWVWTGKELIAWGGITPSHGWSYRPDNDTWKALPSLGQPAWRRDAKLIWTGKQLIVAGGHCHLDEDHQIPGCDTRALEQGGIYDPSTEKWEPFTTFSSATGKAFPNGPLFWTGSTLVVHSNETPVGIRILDWETKRWSNPLVGSNNRKRYSRLEWTGVEFLLDLDDIFYPLLGLGPLATPVIPSVLEPLNEGHVFDEKGDSIESVYRYTQLHWKSRVIDQFKFIDDFAAVAKRSQVPATSNQIAELKKNADAIVANLQACKQTWSRELPRGCSAAACGCTLIDHPNEIFLSYDNCGTHDPAKIIFREAIRSVLKTDEATSQRLADISYSIWEAEGFEPGPYWVHPPRSTQGPSIYFPRVKISSSETAVPQYDRVEIYNVHEKTWRKVFPTNKPDFIEYPKGSGHDTNRSFQVKNQLVVFQNNYQSYFVDKPVTATGLVYDVTKNQWLPLPVKDAPESRVNAAQVATDEALFVFGGRDEKGKWLSNGALYEPEKGWRKIAPNPLLSLEEQSWVWTGKELFAWGGSVASTGWTYRPDTNTWKALPALRQPAWRSNARLLWTGHHVIVAESGTERGGLYDPARDTWDDFATFDSDGGKAPRGALFVHGSTLGMYSYTAPRGIRILNGETKRWSQPIPNSWWETRINVDDAHYEYVSDWDLRWTGEKYILNDFSTFHP